MLYNHIAQTLYHVPRQSESDENGRPAEAGPGSRQDIVGEIK